MRKRASILVLMFCLALAVTGGAILQHQQKNLAEKLIRLHVVARSDSDHDQAVKLQVRDAVLDCVRPLLEETDAPSQILAEHLPQIEQAAAAKLQSLGEDAEVQVTLGNERFPTRDYDTFSLPAGVYESLRVTIGPGRGRNWWCVVFPSICLTSSMDELQLAAQTAGLTEGEVRLITGENAGYVLKFKSMELLQALKSRLLGEK